MKLANVEFLLGENAFAPKRNNGDAGYDFFVPKDFETTHLKPGESILINSHVRSKLDTMTALIAFNKSGIATKRHLQVGACVVDPSYQGEIHMHVFNWGKDTITIEAGDKLVQFVPVQFDAYPAVIHTGISTEEFYGIASERGEGGFGSTGDKHGE